MNKLLLPSLLLATLSGSAAAQDGVKWDMVGLGYQQIKLDDADVKLDGFGITGRKLFHDLVFVDAAFASVGDDESAQYRGVNVKVEADLKTYSIGFGVKHTVMPSTDIFIRLAYEAVETEITTGASDRSNTVSGDANGSSVSTGVRAMFGNIELGGTIGLFKLEDADAEVTLGLNAQYHFDNGLAVGLGYGINDDAKSTQATIAYYF